MKTPNNVAFTIFGMDIMWYGILVAFAIAAVVCIICVRAPKHHGISSDKMMNFSIILVICGIVGARFYYILFNMSYYLEDFSRIFKFREGGLAIHGALIGGAIAAIILCRFWKERPLNILDICFAVIPLGQAIGRWGNFFNGEAHGGETDLPWAVIIDGVKYHPTFLYESIWCLLLFAFLIIVDNRRKFEGQVFLLYAILYSVERFFVEGMRTDSLMLFGVMKQAQVLSVIAIIVGILAYIFLNKRANDFDRAEAFSEGPVAKAIDEVEEKLISAKDAVEKGLEHERPKGKELSIKKEAKGLIDVDEPDASKSKPVVKAKEFGESKLSDKLKGDVKTPSKAKDSNDSSNTTIPADFKNFGKDD